MDDVRKSRESKEISRSIFWSKLLLFIWKKRWYLILFLLILLIIIFPINSGQLIGQWITDFVGTLIKYIKI